MTVKGSVDALAQFASRMDGKFSLEKVLPTPEKLLVGQPDASEGQLGRSLDGSPPAWYAWRLQHWGTKWDIRDDEGELFVEDDGQTYRCEFDTAWNPPLIVLENLSRQIPDLEIEIKYSDETMSFVGHGDFKNGESDFVFEEPKFEEPKFKESD